MNNRSNDIDAAAEGTCKWLFHDKTYNSWAGRNQSLLWIRGKPGSGKSTLLRHALHNTGASHIGDRAFVLSFFFHGRGTELQRTPLGLFRSLLYQLLEHVPDALCDLVDTFQQRCEDLGKPDEKWQWNPSELQQFFKSSLPRVLESRPVWLYVDALDECGQQNAIELAQEFKSLIHGLQSTSAQFRICFTCRHFPILDFGSEHEICLEDKNQMDISTYVQTQLCTQTTMPPKIPRMITDHASGVFMWARLVIQRVLDLVREGYGWRRVEEDISSIPPDLNKLYQELVRSMDKSPASLRLVQWICFATRPLSLDELRWALIVSADCSLKSLQQCRNAEDFACDCDMMERRLRTLSRGLAEVVPSSNVRVVQFIHQSVKDFFVEEGLSSLDNSSKPAETQTAKADVVGIAHYQLSRTCVRYLKMEELAQSTTRDRSSLLFEFPLLGYVTTSWVSHTEQSETREVPQDDLLGYFGWPSEALMGLWVHFYNIVSPYSDKCPSNGTSMLHVVSRYQLIGLLRVILQRVDQDGTYIDGRDNSGRTPLSWAAGNGHVTVVKLLLDTGKADASAKDKLGRTPLWLAAEKCYAPIVKLLLDTGKADINAKDKNGRTQLIWGARKGYVAMVKLLLETGKADVNAKDNNGQTPLTWASRNGHTATVQLLLSSADAHGTDTDVNAKGIIGATLGLVATGYTCIAIAKKLLLSTAKVWISVKGRIDPTLLLVVCCVAVARAMLLLHTGEAGINTQGNNDRTPLSCATEKGHAAVAGAMLLVGCYAAVARAMLLLHTGEASINTQGNNDRTPLSWAAEKGHAAVVKLLLEMGKADVNGKDKSGQTPLWWAAEKGHTAVVQLLLETGKADVNAKDQIGHTPLLRAAWNGHTAVVQLLLDTGKADVNSKSVFGQTPLSRVSLRNYTPIVKLLLGTGKADINVKDNDGRTPLSKAAGGGSTAVVQLLLDTGEADIDVKDDNGRTPLSWAAGGGHTAVVELLLDIGKADVSVEDEDGRAPLSWAAERGNMAVVQLLLDTGKAHVNAEDADGRTPLSLADQNGHKAIANLLQLTPSSLASLIC
ncbi:unnamed protein product [Penicillium egyptiacum]|uniref:Nephrocystin 3-like N-terminal domain-containing protein n=1 Tax=Penicillium egyptiacum TaxID=1303716 RepID=A0A9W4K681_9EURO|nr:unnamed protein product [Penicillium egyptiacum]